MKLSADHILAPLFELAQSDPNRVVFTFVDDQGQDVEVRTASQMADRAQSLAYYLLDGCGLKPGDAVLLVYPPSLEFIDAFAACMLAGLVAAPVYPPNLARPESDLARLELVAKASNAKAMLTNRAYRWGVRLSFKGRWPSLPWIVTHLRQGFDGQAKGEIENPIALLQFTSGSTSTPKGVRITHANLRHQLSLYREQVSVDESIRGVMWVPQYHDLGLICGITAGLHAQGSYWILSPFSFLKKPAVWFDVINRVRATHTASPNFGFELVTRKTTLKQRASWDLSCLRLILSAAEPIVPRTMDAFFKAFEVSKLSPQAFYPGYGLAEHAVGVTFGGQQRFKLNRQKMLENQQVVFDDNGLEITGCGKPYGDIKVRIVSSEGKQALPEDQIGEIWVQSASVADGYEGNPEATQEVFKNVLSNEPGFWLKTGDLGFLHGGELFITGRQKDLVIIRGRNIHPEDIEESLRYAHPAIRPGGLAAFAVMGEATEELAVLIEIDDAKHDQAPEALQAAKHKLGETWGLQARLIAVPTKTVKKTTSGKIQRSANQKAFLANQIKELGILEPQEQARPINFDEPLFEQISEIPVEERVDWLIAGMQAIVLGKLSNEVTQVGPDDFLPNTGLDSLASAELLQLLEEKTGQTLPSTLFIEYPTLRKAAMRVLSIIGVEHTGELAVPDLEQPLVYRPPIRSMLPGKTRIGIVGGGVAGLVSAYELAKLGYKQITLFESEANCGGKVLTEYRDQEAIELGQNFFVDSFSTVIGLANELELPLNPADNTFQQWTPDVGYEEGPARKPSRIWMRNLAKAGRVELNPRLGLPVLLEGREEPFSSFIKRHHLSVHPMFYFDWNAMGYGFDLEMPACYVLAYLQHVGSSSNVCYLPNGNQQLWTTLAERLEKTWGVQIRRGHKVSSIHPTETGVLIDQEHYDEVISAVPPDLLASLLPQEDPLQPLLEQFEYMGYSIHAIKAKGLFEKGAVLFPEWAKQQGPLVTMQACVKRQGWYLMGQFASGHSKQLDNMPESDLRGEIQHGITLMGGHITEWGPHRTWKYFPHVRKNPVSVLQQAERLQGSRHVWTTGSWMAFETTEHTARHAGHLVRTCFDPADF